MVKIFCDKEDTISSGSQINRGDKISSVTTYKYNYIFSDDYGRTVPSAPIYKAEYELLQFQVSELKRRIEEVEARERTLIKMLMEKLNGADD